MVAASAHGSCLRADAGRLLSDLADLARFVEGPGPGCTRPVFGTAHRGARTWLADRMIAAGLRPRVDGGGNLVGERPGASSGAAPIVVGSHSDTVPGGGAYDGALGVMAGIELARVTAEDDVALDHDLWVVDFLGEEPNPWGLSCVGSRAAAGALHDVDLARTAADGRSLADALQGEGLEAAGVLGARWPAFHAAVELHIEQGPVLEARAAVIGNVTAIVGITRFVLRFGGRRDHAGTMPMDLRHDALAAAAEAIVAVERSGRSCGPEGGPGGVATVGRLEVEPGSINVIADHVAVFVEVRSEDPRWIDERAAEIGQAARAAADDRGVALEVQPLSQEAPTPMAAGIRSAIADAARRYGHEPVDLASGAEHDTRQLARLGPVGMIFVPSRDGRSHCPEEWTDPEHLVAGTEVLIETVLSLDGRSGP